MQKIFFMTIIGLSCVAHISPVAGSQQQQTSHIDNAMAKACSDERRAQIRFCSTQPSTNGYNMSSPHGASQYIMHVLSREEKEEQAQRDAKKMEAWRISQLAAVKLATERLDRLEQEKKEKK